MRGKKMTDCEVVMNNALKDEEIDVSYDYPPRSKYGYRYDFAIPDLKIDIECDGECFHLEGNSHDRKRDGFSKSKGWLVLRFKRGDIMSDIQSCIKTIKEIIERRKLEKYGKAN